MSNVTMSWFDASGLASIAKSALKEAQRTIDKALDIKDDELAAVPTNTPIDTNSDDFFGTWGVAVPPAPRNERLKLQASLWGSFTGSFFEGPKSGDPNSIDSLDDSVDTGSEHFSRSKLVVQHSDDGDRQTLRLSPSTDEATLVENTNVSDANMIEVQLDSIHISGPTRANKRDESSTNRLSIVSNDSINNSESVELITCSAECATSPESDVLSLSQSLSTSSSALGLKQTSESVEVLGDSLTSPSSVEVLGSSETHDEYSSPLQSLMPNDQVLEKLTPDSVEVIPEDESVAEDTMSYTSLSESTSATVLETTFNQIKPQKMLKDTYQSSPDAITRGPKRLHLNLRDVSLIDTQPVAAKQDLSDILAGTNVIDFVDGKKSDESQSDRTLLESGSDSSTNSVYLKNLIADAMTEKHQIAQVEPIAENVRGTSPLSSESRSDLVKIGSASDHTSGDELETTTSSDIEIISSPNGDSSSTQSRQSPHKQTCVKIKDNPKIDLLCKMTMKKARGHNRELSEASSISDDSPSSEIDRLLKRISEMTEILESRESKFNDLNRRNVELQELNINLKQQLDLILTKQLESPDLSQVTEEYTQRLSALEKKFQQAIREKDHLRKQLETTKQDAATRLSKHELESIVTEKDEIIKELREEGEKLSKQQLQHSNIIKKLRAKEKENETTIKHLKETIESQSSETERLKRHLTAKEDVERLQIDAIHQLTSKHKKMEIDYNQIQSQYDDLNQKYDIIKKSFDAAKKELIEKNRTSNELLAREQLLESLENEKRMTESQNAEIMDQLEDLRMKLRECEKDYVSKENLLRVENGELLRRLEEAEARNEELAQAVLEVSKPLVRQLEQLQATHTMKLANFEKIEQELTVKIGDLQSKLQASINLEKIMKEECNALRAKLTNFETFSSSLQHRSKMLQMQIDQQKTDKQIVEQEMKRQLDTIQEELRIKKEKIEQLSNEIRALQDDKVNIGIQKKESTPEASVEGKSPLRSQSNSPTLSLGKASISESLNSSFWSQDEPFDVTVAPRYTNMFEMQMLQSNLKQREGEVQQLQWELNRREQERSLLNTEISQLLTSVDDLEKKVSNFQEMKTRFDKLQQEYDTLCLLFGEKVEENEELKLDLQDVKDMYKSQIDELLKLQKQS